MGVSEQRQVLEELATVYQEVGVEGAELAGSGEVNVKNIPQDCPFQKIPLSFAKRIAKKLGGILEESKTGKGYRIKIQHNGKKVIVRLQDAGSGGRPDPYFRVAVDDKTTLSASGEYESCRELTHHNIKTLSKTEEAIVELTEKAKELIENGKK